MRVRRVYGAGILAWLYGTGSGVTVCFGVIEPFRIFMVWGGAARRRRPDTDVTRSFILNAPERLDVIARFVVAATRWRTETVV